MKEHIPNKLTSTRTNLPWFNRGLKRMCKVKRRRFKRAKKSKKSRDWESGTLEGLRDRPDHESLIKDPLLHYSGGCNDHCSDLYVSCQVFCDDHPLTLPRHTSYKPFSTRWNWNEWLTLPVKYSELSRNAQLALTVWDIYGTHKVVPVGGTTVSLFGKHGTFRQGMIDLKIWPDIEADGSTKSKTPGKRSSNSDIMSRLSKLSKKHRNGHLTKVDWLDRLTFREIEVINEKQKRESNFLYLMIQFPNIHFDDIDYSVVYFEKGGDDIQHVRTTAEIVTTPDPDILTENLVEIKHHKLARSLRSGPTDRDLKPNAATRDLLNTIISYPPTQHLISEEQDLIWKFRFYLSNQKEALSKFIKSVNWSLHQEASQALDLLHKWAPMDVTDALELLSPAYTHPTVRKYAVARLQPADDEELMLYLLQLVQALKYEDFDEIMDASERESAGEMALIRSTIYQQRRHQSIQSDSSSDIPHNDSMTGPGGEEKLDDPLRDALLADTLSEIDQTPMDLATFLIVRACNNSTVANYFCWYLKVECDNQDLQTTDTRIINMYVAVLKRFSQALHNGGNECKLRRAAICGQQLFMEKLEKVVKLVAKESGHRMRKVERLQALILDPETHCFNFNRFEELPLPLDPEIKICGIEADTATLFKSALMPCRLTFRTRDNGQYIAIFKHGDDLRQDQLVLQIITLMDRLLRKENLDLKLTPYKVLATSSKHGFVQFVESTSVAEVLVTEGSILNFFRKHAPSTTGPNGVAHDIMDNYIRSCAGYCVITYLLGVGDRHLDNLLLCKSGKLFHIDFGFILGRDPKPMPPPMKLSKEMVEAMGGMQSDLFSDFKKQCYTSFLALRRSSNLILNLFALMVDANVPDIALEPDKTVRKVQDKLRLDLNDEEAVHYLQSMIEISASATMAGLMDQVHKIAQYWRK